MALSGMYLGGHVVGLIIHTYVRIRQFFSLSYISSVVIGPIGACSWVGCYLSGPMKSKEGFLYVVLREFLHLPNGSFRSNQSIS